MIKDDGLHKWDFMRRVLSLNALIMFFLSGRSLGKSTLAVDLALKDYFNNGALSIWFRRYEADYQNQLYVSSFLEGMEDYDAVCTMDGVFETLKEEDEDGNLTIALDGNGRPKANKAKPIIFFASINTMSDKIRSIPIKNVKWEFFEEFIPNLKLPNSRYLPDEGTAFMTQFYTITRNNDYKTRAIFLGNPYQMYNPYFDWMKIKPSEVIKHKDKIYVPHRKQNGEPLIAVAYMSLDERLLEKLNKTGYSDLARLNPEFYNIDFRGDSYIEPIKVKKRWDPYNRLICRPCVENVIIDCYQQTNGDLWFCKTTSPLDKTSNVIYFDKSSVGGSAKYRTARKNMVNYVKQKLARGQFSVKDENTILWVRLLF